VSGDEPLLVGEAADAIRARPAARGLWDRSVFFHRSRVCWDDLRQATQSLVVVRRTPFFSELRMPSGKPDKGCGSADRYRDAPRRPCGVLVITDKLDNKASETPWVRAFEKHACGDDLAGGDGRFAGMARAPRQA